MVGGAGLVGCALSPVREHGAVADASQLVRDGWLSLKIEHRTKLFLIDIRRPVLQDGVFKHEVLAASSLLKFWIAGGDLGKHQHRPGRLTTRVTHRGCTPIKRDVVLRSGGQSFSPANRSNIEL